MNLIERVKNILVSPKPEWDVIDGENAPHMKVFTQYVLLLALIPAIGYFIGYGLVGIKIPFFGSIHDIGWGIKWAIGIYVQMTLGVYITAFVFDALAPSFGAQKNFDKAFSLAAFAYTPMFIGGIFYALPVVSWLASIAGLYGLYLLYIGLKPMMKVPEEKNMTYFIVSLVVMVVVFAVLTLLLAAILPSAKDLTTGGLKDAVNDMMKGLGM